MQKKWVKAGAATLALGVLSALMIQAGLTAGCGTTRGQQGSTDASGSTTPAAAAAQTSDEKTAAPDPDDEVYFPASKAGPVMKPRPRPASNAPLPQQQAAPAK